MNTITIEISGDRFQELQEIATRLGISLEELVLMGIDKLLSEPEEEFQEAVDYVLKKNAELYQRLA